MRCSIIFLISPFDFLNKIRRLRNLIKERHSNLSLTHSNQLFARDLKHLVDPKYSAAPLRRQWSLASLLTIAGLVGAGLWLVYTALTPFVTAKHPDEIARSGSTSQSPTESEQPQKYRASRTSGRNHRKQVASARNEYDNSGAIGIEPSHTSECRLYRDSNAARQ